MAEQPKAPQTTPATQQSDLSAELAKARKENAELTTKLEAYQREAEQMRAALDTARDEGKLGGLPKGAVQLAESFTIVQSGKPVDARPGDVLTPGDVATLKKNLPAGIRAFSVDPDTIAEVRARKLARA
jgi:hypothetical protein